MFAELSPFYPTFQGVRVTVKVTPRAAKTRIGEVVEHNGTNLIKVYVTAAPVDNQANTAVIELLSKEWGIAKTNFTLVRGATDRVKTLEIQGDPQKLLTMLQAIWGG